MILIARNETRALGLEFVVIFLFVYYMAKSRILFTQGFLTLPPSWQAWLVDNALLFVWGYALWTPLAFIIWKHALAGARLLPERKKPAPQRYVRRQDHAAPPPLPSVKELSDELGESSP